MPTIKTNSTQTSLGEISVIALILISAYLAVQMIADIASLKIGTFLGQAVDLGTFLYPLTFTLRDMVHKNLGKKAARSLIWIAASINAFMSLFLMFASAYPAHESWPLNEAFTAILAPVWRIVIASIIAELASELLDTEIYHHLATKHENKPQWLRVLISNSLTVPIDNVLFCLLAFYDGKNFDLVLSIFVVNLIFKYGMTLLSLPLIYLIPKKS